MEGRKKEQKIKTKVEEKGEEYKEKDGRVMERKGWDGRKRRGKCKYEVWCSIPNFVQCGITKLLQKCYFNHF